MSTLGNTSTPSYGWFFRGINVENAVYNSYTVGSQGALVTEIDAYFGTNTGTATCYLAVWRTSDGVLLCSKAVSAGAGGHSAGAQGWHSVTLDTPYFIPPNTGICIGFWVPQANGFVTSVNSGGGTTWIQTRSAFGNLGGGTDSGYESIGAYITYTPGGIARVKDAGSMRMSQCYAKNGGVMRLSQPYVKNGGTMRQCG